MVSHEDWIEAGFCPSTYEGEWCRLWVDHEEPHAAPWEYNFPRQEKMVRWTGEGENVQFLRWETGATSVVGGSL